jgi:hypothetical protein
MGEVLGETSLVREEKKKEEKERGDVAAELLFTEGRQPRWHPTMLQGRQWVPATSMWHDTPGPSGSLGHPAAHLECQDGWHLMLEFKYGNCFLDGLLMKIVSKKGQNEKITLVHLD